MQNYKTDTYCSLPFSGFDNRTKSICCLTKFNTKFETYTDAVNSPEVTKLQEDLLNGVRNPICQQCWNQEDLGIQSMRNHQIPKYPAEKKLKRLTIDSGNVCNLACRTCGPHSSSAHIKEFEAKYNKKFNLAIKKTNIELLKTEDYSSIEFISILGGEPFQNLEHLEIIKLIVDQGYAKNCILSYVTNGTIPLSDKIKNLFSNFKNVGITVSVDGTDKQFEYIRTNGDWGILNNNISNFKKSLAGLDAGIHGHPIISALNILYLEELFQWYTDQNIGYDIGFCNYPKSYSFNIFNDNQKNTLIEYLKKSKFNIQSIIQHLNNSVFDKDALEQFYTDVEFTKNFKNLDINFYLPKLMDLLHT